MIINIKLFHIDDKGVNEEGEKTGRGGVKSENKEEGEGGLVCLDWLAIGSGDEMEKKQEEPEGGGREGGGREEGGKGFWCALVWFGWVCLVEWRIKSRRRRRKRRSLVWFGLVSVPFREG